MEYLPVNFSPPIYLLKTRQYYFCSESSRDQEPQVPSYCIYLCSNYIIMFWCLLLLLLLLVVVWYIRFTLIHPTTPGNNRRYPENPDDT